MVDATHVFLPLEMSPKTLKPKAGSFLRFLASALATEATPCARCALASVCVHTAIMKSDKQCVSWTSNVSHYDVSQCKQGWPRCPSCKNKLSLSQAGAAAQEDGMDETGAALADTLPCWKCQAPVRSSWPRCPGCKAEKESSADAVSHFDSEAAASELSPRKCLVPPPSIPCRSSPRAR